ncbi:unnamed protein product [Amoebophrya sp. A120]|nr:unnamed protein product [Amoebophrya sp. A120]|eukprot:GSA120T00011988001.1
MSFSSSSRSAGTESRAGMQAPEVAGHSALRRALAAAPLKTPQQEEKGIFVALLAEILESAAGRGPQQHGDIPAAFKCPLSQEIMWDPVRAADGYSYSRSQLKRYFEQQAAAGAALISPLTRSQFPSTVVAPNFVLRAQIDTFFRRRYGLEWVAGPGHAAHLCGHRLLQLQHKVTQSEQTIADLQRVVDCHCQYVAKLHNNHAAQLDTVLVRGSGCTSFQPSGTSSVETKSTAQASTSKAIVQEPAQDDDGLAVYVERRKLQEENTNLKKQLKDARAVFPPSNTTQDGQAELIQRLQLRLEQLESESINMRREKAHIVKALQERNTRIRNSESQLTTQVQKLKDEMEENLQSSRLEHAHNLKALQAENSKIRNSESELTTRVQKLKDENEKNLQSAVVPPSNRNTQLQDGQAELIKRLQLRLRLLESEGVKMRRENAQTVKALQEENSNFRRSELELTTQVQKLKHENEKNLQSCLERSGREKKLQTENSELRKEVARVVKMADQDNGRLREERKAANTEVARLKSLELHWQLSAQRVESEWRLRTLPLNTRIEDQQKEIARLRTLDTVRRIKTSYRQVAENTRLEVVAATARDAAAFAAPSASTTASTVDPEALFPMLADFRCPILHDVMQDPVCTKDGHTYDRSAISEWFKTGNRTSPITGKALISTKLRPNHALRKAIAAYAAERAVAANEAHRAALKTETCRQSIRFFSHRVRILEAECAALRSRGSAKDAQSNVVDPHACSQGGQLPDGVHVGTTDGYVDEAARTALGAAVRFGEDSHEHAATSAAGAAETGAGTSAGGARDEVEPDPSTTTKMANKKCATCSQPASSSASANLPSSSTFIEQKQVVGDHITSSASNVTEHDLRLVSQSLRLLSASQQERDAESTAVPLHTVLKTVRDETSMSSVKLESVLTKMAAQKQIWIQNGFVHILEEDVGEGNCVSVAVATEHQARSSNKRGVHHIDSAVEEQGQHISLSPSHVADRAAKRLKTSTTSSFSCASASSAGKMSSTVGQEQRLQLSTASNCLERLAETISTSSSSVLQPTTHTAINMIPSLLDAGTTRPAPEGARIATDEEVEDELDTP